LPITRFSVQHGTPATPSVDTSAKPSSIRRAGWMLWFHQHDRAGYVERGVRHAGPTSCASAVTSP